MVEPVQGFRTSSGEVFDDEQLAILAETRDNLFSFFKANGCNEAQANALSKMPNQLLAALSDLIAYQRRTMEAN